MIWNPDTYAEVARILIEIGSFVLALILGVLKKYHSNKRRQAESENEAKENRIRELEVTLLMKKRELEEQKIKNDKLDNQLKTVSEEKKKVKDRLESLRDAIKHHDDE